MEVWEQHNLINHLLLGLKRMINDHIILLIVAATVETSRRHLPRRKNKACQTVEIAEYAWMRQTPQKIRLLVHASVTAL